MLFLNRIYVFLISLFSILNNCEAIKVGKGVIQIDDSTFQIDQNEIIPINLADTRLSIGFSLVDESNDSIITPKQVVIELSSENLNSSSYFYPKLTQNKNKKSFYEANLPISKISKFLLVQDVIDISILTGDDESPKFNSIFTIAKFKPSEKLQQDVNNDIKFPIRFGEKNEIKHIFHTGPKSAPSLISTQFILDIFIAFFGLLFFWHYYDAINFSNINKISPLSFAFVGLLFIFEYVFYDYYLGATIFTTLTRSSVIGALTIYIGSKVLKNLYKLRDSGLR